jgi:hypothetical protein
MAVADRTWPSSRGIVDRRGSLVVNYGGLWVSDLQYGTEFRPAVPCCLFRMNVVMDPVFGRLFFHEQVPR